MSFTPQLSTTTGSSVLPVKVVADSMKADLLPLSDVEQSPEQFTYDADGNMLTDGRFSYVWNGENRLVEAHELHAPTSRAPYTITYAYDHRGRMVSKRITENAATNSPFSILHSTFVWDDWNIIREIVREGGSATVTDNVWGLDINGTFQGAGGDGGLLAVFRFNSSTPNSSTPQLFFPTYDANGNVSEYVTTNGEVVAHYDYSPFGETLIESGDFADTFTHRFSTKPCCPITGLYEYQMRKYRPEIGRWLSRDPIGESGNSLYYFCGNNALQTYDINGYTSPNPAGDGLTWVPDYKYVNWGSPELGRNWALTWYLRHGEPVSIRKVKEAEIVKDSCCCAKVGKGASYELTIHGRWPTQESSVGFHTTLNGWESIIRHEQKRASYILVGFQAYYSLIASSGTLATKCGMVCRKNGWEEARDALLEYLADIEFKVSISMNEYEQGAQGKIGRENYNNYVYVIQNGKRLMDGMKQLFTPTLPDVHVSDFNTECPFSDPMQ